MKSLKSCIAYAHILAVLSFPAAAQDVSRGPYVSGGVGAFFLSDSLLPIASGESWNIAYDTGHVVSGALGYRFANGFRVEGEVGYRHNKIDEMRATSGRVLDASGNDMTNLSLMANFYRDFQMGLGFTPYLGAGLGGKSYKIGHSSNWILYGSR